MGKIKRKSEIVVIIASQTSFVAKKKLLPSHHHWEGKGKENGGGEGENEGERVGASDSVRACVQTWGRTKALICFVLQSRFAIFRLTSIAPRPSPSLRPSESCRHSSSLSLSPAFIRFLLLLSGSFLCVLCRSLCSNCLSSLKQLTELEFYIIACLLLLRRKRRFWPGWSGLSRQMRFFFKVWLFFFLLFSRARPILALWPLYVSL